MILKTRVDCRLLHGQVAVSWTAGIGADSILIANDAVANDQLRKTTMKLAKPQNCKLVIKDIDSAISSLNSGVTDKYKLFVVVESIEDAFRLAKSVSEVKSINLGLVKTKEGTRNISKSINITSNEEKMLKELISDGIEVEIRQVPNDKKVYAKDVL